MAISAPTNWYVAGGSANNGGGFDATMGGTNRALTASAYKTIDGATITCVVHTTTTQVNITGYTVASTDIGNVINNVSGSGTVQRLQITAVDVPNNRYTVDKSAGTAGQTIIGALGGALAKVIDIAVTGSVLAASNKIYTKGALTWTSAENVTAPAVANITIEAYVATPGDGSWANRQTWQASGSGVTMITIASSSASGWTFLYINFDGNSATTSRALTVTGANFRAERCEFQKFTNTAVAVSSSGKGELANCAIHDHTTNAVTVAGPITLVDCDIYSNTATPISISAGGFFVGIRSQWRANTGTTTDGISTSSSSGQMFLYGCTMDGTGRHHISTGSGSTLGAAQDCLLTNPGASTTGYGFNTSASSSQFSLRNCAHYGGTGATNGANAALVQGQINLTADPYTNKAGGDFSLNDVSGGGHECRRAGFATALNSGGAAPNHNVGAYDLPAPPLPGIFAGLISAEEF